MPTPAGSKCPLGVLQALGTAGVGDALVEAVASRMVEVDHLPDKDLWRLLASSVVPGEAVLAARRLLQSSAGSTVCGAKIGAWCSFCCC